MIDADSVHGAIINKESGRRDSLFRVSLKAVIFDDDGRVLIIKERGRDWWDLPGGGLEHGESIREALARELYEEVLLKGNFDYQVILVEDAHFQDAHNMYQMRITFIVNPESTATLGAGEDGDEVKFVDPAIFETSELLNEQRIFEYSKAAKIRLA